MWAVPTNASAMPLPLLQVNRQLRLPSKRTRRIGLGVLAILAAGICIAQPPTQTYRYPLPTAQPPPPIAEQPQPAANQPPPQAVLFQPGQIVARVGDKTILYGDVAPTVNLILALTKNEAERQALEAQHEAVVKSLVMQAAQTKMLLMEFERGMPSELRSDVKKRTEAETKLRKSVRNAFDRSLTAARERVEQASEDDTEKLMQQDPSIMRLALLMKQRGLLSQGELDIALREMGTTLARQAKDYGDHMMGMEAVQTALGNSRHSKGGKGQKHEITHQELLDYYQAHQADFQVPAKASFEILTARFARFENDRARTHAHAAMMGNEVFLGGVPFAAVAKRHSQEPLAESGGQYENITPGSLASKTIDQAVFSLEIGKLSQIIEDDQGYHILRVKQRTPAGVVAFEDAQSDIRNKIEDQKKLAERQKYFTELRERTKIWTIYDPPADAAASNPAPR